MIKLNFIKSNVYDNYINAVLRKATLERPSNDFQFHQTGEMTEKTIAFLYNFYQNKFFFVSLVTESCVASFENFIISAPLKKWSSGMPVAAASPAHFKLKNSFLLNRIIKRTFDSVSADCRN